MYNWIILILIILLYFYINPKHSFWDKQPVARKKHDKYGLISINPIFNIDLRNNYDFSETGITNKTLSFINNHFSPYNKFQLDFLKNTLTLNTTQKIHNIHLYDKNKLVGFIHAKPINIIVESIKINIYYVDFLCIHTDYRKKNLATFLIAKLINNCHSKQVFLFKKDNNPLPFNYINKTAYYYKKHISRKLNSVLNEFNNKFKNIETIYNFILSIKKEYTCYDNINLQHFKELYFNNKTKHIVVESKNNVIISVCIYVNNLFNDRNKMFKTLDIEYIYIKKKYLGVSTIIEYLGTKCDNNTLLTCIDQMHNRYFIEKYDFNKSMDLYYHMYNYTINKQLKNSEFSFNLL